MLSWRRIIGLVVLGAFFVTGCVRRELVCLKRGGDSWYEIRSKNFVLQTNLGKGAALARSRQLERMHHALAYAVQLVLPSSVPPTDPIEVIHFAHRVQLQEFVGKSTGGFMSKQNGYVLVASSESHSGKERDNLLKHELTHRFVAHQMHQYPRWLTEGLAGFFETLQVEGKQAIVGALPVGYSRYWFGNTAFMPSIEKLRNMGASEFYDNKNKRSNYWASWRLVHFLTNKAPMMHKRFRYYTASLAAGISEAEAWKMSFGGAGEFEGALRSYRGMRSIQKWTIDYEPPSIPTPEVRALGDGEVHVLWARLSYLQRGGGDTGKKNNERRFSELADAKAHDPKFDAAQFWEIELSDQKDALASIKDLRGYVSKHKDDTRALHSLVSLEIDAIQSPSNDALQHSSQRLIEIEPLVKSLVEQAKHGRELNLIAWYYALTNNPEEGLKYAVPAVKHEPSSAPSLDTYALLLYQAGRADLALTVQKRAVELYGESGSIPKSVADRLRLYEEAQKQ